jgi:hypothetical protein
MSDSAPDLHMLSVVVGDMPASLDFYHRLGIAVPGGEVAAGGHAQLRMPGGFSLELHTAESARLWHGGWRTDPVSVGVVIGFSLPTREAVDEGNCPPPATRAGSRCSTRSGVCGMRSWLILTAMTSG